MFRILLAFGVFAALSGCDGAEGGSWIASSPFEHVLVIVLENQDYSDAIADPYLASVASRGALLSNFSGLAHPSYSNYLDMVGGQLFASFVDIQRNLDERSIADPIEEAGLTWKAYAEDYPGGCDLTSSQGLYARKHVPFLSFQSIQNDPARCARVVPGSQFATDVAAGSLSNYMFYTPNLNDDGHNSDLPTASAWLRGLLEPLLANPSFMARTLIEITFDESRTYTNNHIYTALLGAGVRVGAVSSVSYTHFNFLRTVEDDLGLGPLAHGDGEASPITDVWALPAPSPSASATP